MLHPIPVYSDAIPRPNTFLRLPEVLRRRALSRSSHFRDIASGLCTSPIRIAARCVAWPEYEIDAIVNAQIAGASIDERRELVSRFMSSRAQLKPYALAAA